MVAVPPAFQSFSVSVMAWVGSVSSASSKSMFCGLLMNRWMTSGLDGASSSSLGGSDVSYPISLVEHRHQTVGGTNL